MPTTSHIGRSSRSGRSHISDDELPSPIDGNRIQSPIYSDSRSPPSSLESASGRWPDLPFKHVIAPSDSASRPRHPHSSRHSSSRQSTSRSGSQAEGSRLERAEPPRRRSSHRSPYIPEAPLPPPPARSHRSNSHAHSVAHSEREDHRERRNHENRKTHREHRPREESRRSTSSEDYSGSLDSQDEYMGHPRHLHEVPYVPHAPHGTGSWGPPYGPYMNGYPDHHDSLVRVPRQDPLAYPSHNPLSPPLSAGYYQHPLSPMSSSSTGYFSHDPHGPHLPIRSHSVHRHMGPPRPPSFVSGGGSYYGSEMIPSHYGAPPYPLSPQYHYHHSPPPASHGPVPAPATKEKDERDDQLAEYKARLKKMEDAIEAREKAEQAKRDAEKAEAEAKVRRELEERKRKDELTEAEKKARDAAEKEASEKAKKAKEESDKAIADAKKKTEDLEAAKKKLEEEAKKNKPDPDDTKAPIRFKDAVGRTFSFPYKFAKTWKGMDLLIRKAFMNVDPIGPHVLDGHYDLIGPNGEIILPDVWDVTIKPDWEITMHMWPMPEPPPPPDILFPHESRQQKGNGRGGTKGKKDKEKDKKKSKRASVVMPAPDFIDVGGLPGGSAIPPAGMPPAPPPPGPMMPPPPPTHNGHRLPPGVEDILPLPTRGEANTKRTRKNLPPLAAWMAGVRR